MERYPVGRKFWFAGAFSSYWVEVVKSGRKWATLDNGQRVAHGSRIVEYGGFKTTPTLYDSPKEHRDEIARLQMWFDFKRKVERLPPPAISADALRKIAATLGVKLERCEK